MWELAGVVGLDPRPFTLRQLMDMHRGKCRDAWGRAAMITCIIANANRDPKKRKRPFSPTEFNPYADTTTKFNDGRIPLTKDTIQLLKVFVG